MAHSVDQTLVQEEPILAPRTRVRKNWSNTQKMTFRIFGTYIFLLCIPMEAGFYQALFHLDLSQLHYLHLQSLAAFYPPKFIVVESESGVWGVLSYINLFLMLDISILIGSLWTWCDRKPRNDDKLYYWVRVIARYRLGYAMVSWGLKKVFPHQMILPTIGVLNTPFGDMAEKKLYWSHVGISLEYEVFLGFAELLPGLLLLHRKTALLGAAFATIVCFNICVSNHVYDGGVAIPAAYYTLIGAFLVWFDLPHIWRLLVQKEDILPYHYYPRLSAPWQQYARTGAKAIGHSIFVGLAAFLWGKGWYKSQDNYNIPTNAGLKDAKGYYHVTEFRLNNTLIPYSPQDSLRWHDVALEGWSTLSYKTNRPAFVDRMKVYSPHKRKRDLAMTRFELGGNAGDRRYFYYEIDSVNQVLHLENKNPQYEHETLTLAYQRPSQDRITLRGRNEFKDSIFVVLDRVPKNYLLHHEKAN